MTQKIVSTVAVLLSVFILVSVAAAATPHAVTATSGPDTVAVTAGFTPDKLGASTIATGGGVFTTTAGPIPSPLVGLTIKGPAGLGLDLTGAKTCSEDIIYGPIGDKACPKSSIAGSGSGLGLLQLGTHLIQEPFQLSFYLSDTKPNHQQLLMEIYGHSPVVIDIVVPGTVVHYPKPYGIGFHFNIPLIYTIPGASASSVSYSTIKLGNIDRATYTLHGKKAVIPGLVLPTTCPRHGFPVSSSFIFQDGNTVTDNAFVPCKK